VSCDERGQLLYRLRLFAGALGAALGQPSAKADLGCICCFIRIPSRYSCHRREFSANRDEREAARYAADLTATVAEPFKPPLHQVLLPTTEVRRQLIFSV